LENPDSSLRSFNQALDILKTLDGEDNVQISKILNNMGSVYFHLGEKRNALDRLIRALKIQKRWIEDSLCRECTIFDTSVTLSNLAKIYLKRCDYTMSAYLYEEALQLQTKIFKKDHQAVLDTLGNIAYSKAMAGEKTNAIQIYKSLYELQCKTFGIDSRESSETKGLMGVLHAQQSNLTVALRCFSRVLNWQNTNLEQTAPALLNTKNAIEQLSIAIRGDTALLPSSSFNFTC
jgi:tetratricopeptide (TPR) repeat protein